MAKTYAQAKGRETAKRPTASRYLAATLGEDGGRASWAEIASETIVDAITAINAAGDAIMFGSTRDGGALNVVVYADGTPVKLTSSNKEEIEKWLVNVTIAAQA